MLIQWGQEDKTGQNVWTSASFPTAFGSTPSFTATIITPAGTESNVVLTPRIGSLTANGFRWAVTYPDGYGGNQSISWIAIGPKAS